MIINVFFLTSSLFSTDIHCMICMLYTHGHEIVHIPEELSIKKGFTLFIYISSYKNYFIFKLHCKLRVNSYLIIESRNIKTSTFFSYQL